MPGDVPPFGGSLPITMNQAPETEIEFLEGMLAEQEQRYGGPKPPRGTYRPSGSEAVRAAVGEIVMNWGEIVHQINFQMTFLRVGIEVPEELRPVPPSNNRPWAEKEMLTWLLKLSRHRYQGTRTNATEEYAAIIQEIWPLKHHRDRIVHSAIMYTDVPDELNLSEKGKERIYNVTELREIARRIAEARDAMMNFSFWAGHERTQAQLRAHMEDVKEKLHLEESPSCSPRPT